MSGLRTMAAKLSYASAHAGRWLKMTFRRKPSRLAFHAASIAPLIDERYYFRRYPQARELGRSAAEHYVAEGWHEGYDPAPWFSSEGYLSLNADVIGTGISPLAHYAIFGRREGRTVVPTEHVYKPNLSSGSISPDLRALRSREEHNWRVHIAAYTLRRLEHIER